MVKIVIDAGGISKVDDVSLGIKVGLMKKKDFQIVLVGQRKIVSSLEGVSGINTILAQKSLKDFDSLSEAMNDETCSFKIALSILKKWDGDILISLEKSKNLLKVLPAYLPLLDFLDTPVSIGFLIGRNRPVAVGDWGYIQDPTISQLHQVYDFTVLAAKVLNQPKSRESQKNGIIPKLVQSAKPQEVANPIVGILQNDLDYGYSWALDLDKELKEADRKEYLGGISIRDLLVEGKIDALITVGNEGQMISDSTNNFVDGFLANANTSSTRSPIGGLGLSWAKKVLEQTKDEMNNDALGRNQLFLGLEKPILFSSYEEMKSVSNAVNISFLASSRNLQNEIFKIYRKFPGNRLSEEESNKILHGLKGEFEKESEAGVKEIR